MKKHLKTIALILLTISNLTIISCSSDNGSSDGNNYPKIVNIKFEITTSRNSEAIVNRTLNNDTEADFVGSLPYSFTYAQQEVNENDYLKLTYQDNGIYFVDENGSNWTDYNAVLKILVDNSVVEIQTFEIIEGSGAVYIDYTFE